MDELIKHLRVSGVLQTRTIEEALRKVDRENFIPKEYKKHAYRDEALPIGYGQTISQPYTVVFMLELLEAKPGQRILDVGSGSGWTTALLGNIVGKDGEVFGVELVGGLVLFGKENIEKYKFHNVSISQARKDFGLPEKAPFDRILVSASCKEIPQELIDQLSIGGIMVIPEGESLIRVRKISENKIERETYHGFVFVPLH